MGILLTLSSASLAIPQDLSHLYEITNGVSDTDVQYHDFQIKPGEEQVIGDFDGAGEVTHFYITDDSMFHRTDTSGFAYPGLVLRVYWDGNSKPSINVPLWEFFGNFDRESVDYAALPMAVNRWNNTCYLPMPFSRHARFALYNDGDRIYARSVAFGISIERDARFANEQSRLHATWNRSNPTNGMHQILHVEGRGQYIGNILQMHTNFAGWWGEGDTIFTVDGKTYTHTPGTEDEYGSAWEGPKMSHLYAHAYVGNIQTETGKDRLYRWYIPDPVRFQKSLNIEIQNQRVHYGKQVDSSDDYTTVAFWYQDGAHAAPDLPAYSVRIEASKGIQYPPDEDRR
jgi:hypothetical protein